MKKYLKYLLLLSLLMTTSFMQIACSSKTTASTPQESKEEKPLIFGLIQEPTTLDSLTSAERITWLPVSAIYDTIVFTDDEQNLQPGLAEEWDISDDGLTYTFKIREGVKFHNGESLTADDVAFTIEQLRVLQKSEFGMINSVDVIDDTHVQITLENSFSPMLYLFTLPQTGVVNKAAYEADPESYSRNPNGTGPFKFSSWLSGEDIVLDRFEDYWRGPAPMPSVTFRVIADESTEIIALEANEINAYIQVSQSYRQVVEGNDQLAWNETPGSQVYTLAFNNGTYSNGESSIFADNKALRQAICYAINKDDLVIGAIDGTADPLNTPYPEFVINYPEDFDGNVYNPELAKEKLAEAGYPDGLTIKIRTTTQAGYSKPAEVIMGQLSEIGITLELETMERGTYLEEVYNNFDYDMTIWAVSCDYPDVNHGAYRRFYSGMISPANNYMQINDSALDDAIMINRTSADPAEKAAAVLRIAEIIRDESYCLPLYSAQQTLAANANLKGVNINSGMGIDFYRWSW